MASAENAQKFVDSFEEQLKHKNESLSKALITEIIIMLVLCWGFVGLRLLARHFQGVKLKADDYMAMFCLVLISVLTGVVLRAIHFGFGQHLVFLGLDNAFKAGFYIYLAEPLFAVMNTCTKLSVLLLYKSIFSNQKAPFVWGCRIVGVAWIVLGFVASFLFIFQCFPVRLAWTSDHSQKCLDPQKILVASGIAGIILNACILVLPIPMIWNLKLHRRKKIGIAIMFIIGSGDLVVSIVRVWQSKTLNNDLPDATYAQGKTAFCTVLDPTLALICACLPLLRPIVVKVKAGTRTICCPLASKVGTHTGRTSYALAPKKSQSTEPIRSGASGGTTMVDTIFELEQPIKVTNTYKVDSYPRAPSSIYQPNTYWAPP